MYVCMCVCIIDFAHYISFPSRVELHEAGILYPFCSLVCTEHPEQCPIPSTW